MPQSEMDSGKYLPFQEKISIERNAKPGGIGSMEKELIALVGYSQWSVHLPRHLTKEL
jgi:hypothetical protein